MGEQRGLQEMHQMLYHRKDLSGPSYVVVAAAGR